MIRLGFLGAMNRDIVVRAPFADLRKRLGIAAAPLVETAISDSSAEWGASVLRELGARTYLGGSAFNAARVVGLLNDDRALDLAFWGLAGTVDSDIPHFETLQGWGFDVGGVTQSPRQPATCLAMVEPAGRTLLTAPGVNAEITSWLTGMMTDLAHAVARCDVFHVTSYLDPMSADAMAELLERAKGINKDLIVSLDPGMAWVGPRGPALQRLFRQTTILHLNNEEFAHLGGTSGLSNLNDVLSSDWMIVARRHNSVALHTARGSEQLPLHSSGSQVAVTDATGAGDTFCGGFLWSFCRHRRPLQAARIGFTLARHKIAMDGPLALTEKVAADISAHRQRAGW